MAKNRNGRKIALIAAAALVVLIAVIAIASNSKNKTVSSTGTVATGQSNTAPAASATTAPPANRLLVVGQGFTQLAPDSIGNSYVSEAAVLKWNSANQIASEVQVTLTLTNAQGVVVNSDNETVGAVLPGQTVAVTNQAQASGATNLKVQAIIGSTQSGSTTTPTITASGITSSDPDGFGTQTNGTVTSTATKELQNVEAVAVYYSASGAIVGGDFTFVNFIPASGSTSFQISGDNVVPGIASTQVYFSISNLTLGALGG